MTYGLYLSATGVLASSYRQDVYANNLANTETVGFKRDVATFQEQLTEAQLRRLNPASHSDRTLEGLGGGIKVLPTLVDSSPGEVEETHNPLDQAIQGPGFFTVKDHGRTLLTRDGRFAVDRQGFLSLASGGHLVLDDKGSPIKLQAGAPVSIERDGRVLQNGQAVAKVGVFDVPDRQKLSKTGASLLQGPEAKQLRPVDSLLRGGFIERSNAEPTTELTALLDAQRQLEANANLIRYQELTLTRLVNDVGKIG